MASISVKFEKFDQEGSTDIIEVPTLEPDFVDMVELSGGSNAEA